MSNVQEIVNGAASVAAVKCAALQKSWARAHHGPKNAEPRLTPGHVDKAVREALEPQRDAIFEACVAEAIAKSVTIKTEVK